jgi:hypothetical protein
MMLTHLVAATIGFTVFSRYNMPQPQMRSLTHKEAVDTVLSWAEETTNDKKQRALLKHVSTFAICPSNLACWVGVEATHPPLDRELRSVCMFHVSNTTSKKPRIHLWAISCNDDNYGMMIFRAIKNSKLTMVCEYTLDPVWRMEAVY